LLVLVWRLGLELKSFALAKDALNALTTSLITFCHVILEIGVSKNIFLY
jgi:hypothetical protein